MCHGVRDNPNKGRAPDVDINHWTTDGHESHHMWRQLKVKLNQYMDCSIIHRSISQSKVKDSAILEPKWAFNLQEKVGAVNADQMSSFNLLPFFWNDIIQLVTAAWLTGSREVRNQHWSFVIHILLTTRSDVLLCSNVSIMSTSCLAADSSHFWQLMTAEWIMWITAFLLWEFEISLCGCLC